MRVSVVSLTCVKSFFTFAPPCMLFSGCSRMWGGRGGGGGAMSVGRVSFSSARHGVNPGNCQFTGQPLAAGLSGCLVFSCKRSRSSGASWAPVLDPHCTPFSTLPFRNGARRAKNMHRDSTEPVPYAPFSHCPSNVSSTEGVCDHCFGRSLAAYSHLPSHHSFTSSIEPRHPRGECEMFGTARATCSTK